jgi:hypothetical protein
MSLSSDEIRLLITQLSQLHDDRLPPDQLAELEAKIQTNPTVRRLYVSYSQVLGGLRQESIQKQIPSAASSGTVPFPQLSSETPTLESGADSTVRFASPSLWQRKWFSFLAVGLVGAGFATAAILILLPKQSANGTGPGQVVAWDFSSGSVRSLKLESGTATLALAKVGQVVVEGPAEFSFLGPMRARLAYGRIKMRVSEKSGRGFVVETPGGNVVDLGTEFGLEVDRGGKTSLAVFEGKVDLHKTKAKPGDADEVERFEIGEGVVVGSQGQVDRLMSIVTGSVATFRPDFDAEQNQSPVVISKVTDNLRTAQTKKFYEIVPHGLREDVNRYVDRPQGDWNGVDSEGLPAYLVGADYVKTFNDHKMRKDVRIQVTLARPVRLFIFFDDRLEPPAWLTKDFRNTGDKIGADFGPYGMNTRKYVIGKGPGVSIDAVFSVWERTVSKASTIQLGHNPGESLHASSMYGIAAVPLDPPPLVQVKQSNADL